MKNKIKIIPTGDNTYEIRIGGADISRNVTGLSFVMQAGKTPLVTLQLAMDVELPSGLDALIVAEKKKKG